MFIDYWNRPGSWSRMPEALREMSLALGFFAGVRMNTDLN